MTIAQKFLGNILYIIASVISIVMNFIVKLIENVVILLREVAARVFLIIGRGGCLLLLLLLVVIFRNPVLLLVLISLVVFPIIGAILLVYLKYITKTVTDYLFDKAKYYKYGIRGRFGTFAQYKQAYKREQQERRAREQQRQFNEQKQQWHARFNYWYGSQRNSGEGFAQSDSSFKRQYRESCDILGVSYDADKEQIKLAYRKKAREYHPDLNKSQDATAMFQKINSANEFLSPENIERFKGN